MAGAAPWGPDLARSRGGGARVGWPAEVWPGGGKDLPEDASRRGSPEGVSPSAERRVSRRVPQRPSGCLPAPGAQQPDQAIHLRPAEEGREAEAGAADADADADTGGWLADAWT